MTCISILSQSKIVLLADDAKIFKNISCIDDAVKLRTDIENIYKWCQQNAMDLNLNTLIIL